VAVRFRALPDAEFAAWLPSMRERYAESMLRDGGFTPAAAHAKAARDMELLFPGDVRPEEHGVYVIEADAEQVGELWIAEADDDGEPALWVYNVEVAERHRGRGFGREAMRFAEAEARRRGVHRIVLNVFGRNQIARDLYRSLGYEEQAIRMSKQLGAT
jgi:GNAT superfamily N-acetyltransferase